VVIYSLLLKMTIPLKKVLLTSVRYLMRPINNQIIKRCKTASKETYQYKFFAGFGQYANVFEVKMNRALVGSKGLGTIKPLSDDIAFNTGVEWFTEVFVFYGILFSIAFYELYKASVASQQTKDNLEYMLKQSKINQDRLAELRA
jgi:hypothetical protein